MRRRRVRNPWPIDDLEALVHGHADDLSRFFPKSAEGTLEYSDEELYFGRRVVWIGSAEGMIRAKREYTLPIEGNIFDGRKLAAVRDAIEASPDRVVFVAPYGTANLIEPIDVAESHQYFEDLGWDRPYTTGDDELDAWLAHPEEALEHITGRRARRQAEAELKRELKRAVARRSGDLGEIAVTISDGNHRAFGAFLAGERYVYVIIEENQMQDIAGGHYPEVAAALE